MIVAFQRHTLLPLDDCPYALQPSISARGASGLQGWRRNRVYPDFLLRLTGEGERLLVLETKGKQFDNDDTAFKRQLMAALQNAYERPAAGEVELFEDSPEAVRLTMLMQEDNWKPTLAGTLGD